MTGVGDGWLNALIGLMQGAQVALLQALAVLGLVGASHGQPAWPWALKLSGENLLIDLGQARRLAGILAIVALVVVLLLLVMVLGAWLLYKPNQKDFEKRYMDLSTLFTAP